MTRWRWGVPVVLALAGLVFVTGAATSHGTDLRTDRRTELADLVAARQERVQRQTEQVAQLRSAVDAVGSASDVLTPRERARLTQLEAAAGFTAVRGAGVSVTLDDASIPASGIPSGLAPDDYVVHQQDVQAVVNALWAGQARAVTVMGQRLIATSAVRCVGNTLILQGQVYSPPFVIAAVGDPDRLQAALTASPQVRAYRQWAKVVGLTYGEVRQDQVVAPAYDGAVDLQHAAVPAAPGQSR